MTEMHKEKISLSLKGKPSKNQNTKEKVSCPYCLKEGQNLAMKRHHFENCKMK